MRVAFMKNCQCASIRSTYPIPAIHTRAPRASDPLAYVELIFSCPDCGAAWREINADNMGESSGAEIGSKLIIEGSKSYA